MIPLHDSKKSLLTLILGISLVFFLIVLIGYLAVHSQQQAAEEQIYSELETIAELKAGTISDWYQERRSDAEVAMHNQMPFQYLQIHEKTGKPDHIREDLTAWMDSLVKNYNYRGIVLLNQTGDMVVSVPASAEVSDFSKNSTLEKTLLSDTPVFTDLFLDPVSKDRLMEFWVPVRLRTGESSMGVLVLQMDPAEYLYPLIQTWPTPSRTAESLITRLSGENVLFLNDLRHVPNASLSLTVPVYEEDVPAVMAAKGQHGIVKGNDYRGVPVLAYISDIPDTPWYIIAKIDQDEIYAPFRAFSQLVTGVIILLLFVAGLVVLVFWKVRENEFISHQLQQKQHELFLAERVRLFMQQANDAILILDKDWHILEVNDAAVQMYGYSPEEFKEKNLFDLRSDNAKKDIQEDLDRLSQTNSLIISTDHKGKDGRIFSVEDSIRIIDIQGARYIQAIIRDISERKRYELELLDKNAELYSLNEEVSASYEELASQEEELRDQMEMLREREIELVEMNHRLNEAQQAGRVGIWEYYVRTNKIWGTEGALRIYGLSPPPDGMYDISVIMNCIQDRDRITSAINALIERNIPFDTTYLLHPADGSPDRFISTIGVLQYDEENNPYKIVGVIQDITEKHLLEEEVKQYQEKLLALFNSPILGSVFSDIHGRVFEANDEFLRIIGYTREEFVRDGVDWTRITPPEYSGRDTEAIVQAQKTGNCPPYEKQYLRRDGTRIWVLIGYVLVGETREQAVAFVLDISQLKANEDEIRSLNQVLEERVIERTDQLQFINEELQGEVEERLSAEKKLQEALSVLSATVESTADGIFVVDAYRRVSVYNKTFADMWQIPDAVLRQKDEKVILKEQVKQVKDPDSFCSKITEIYHNPGIDSFDVIELADGRIFERISKPQRIGYTIVGRVFSFRDVTRHKEMEAQIEKSLREKEILLKEIHHRVKNNMQVVSSLLFMQSRLSDDPRLKEILLESQNRVKSIALVHEELYQSMDLDRIDYTRYLRKITRNIFDTYKVDTSRISLSLPETSEFLTISKAVPCSLIVNELISNSLKHAFPKSRTGTIRIEFQLQDGMYSFIYADDGIGISPEMSLKPPKTLGLELIQGLVKQLTGTMQVYHDQGVRYEIFFPE